MSLFTSYKVFCHSRDWFSADPVLEALPGLSSLLVLPFMLGNGCGVSSICHKYPSSIHFVMPQAEVFWDVLQIMAVTEGQTPRGWCQG